MDQGSQRSAEAIERIIRALHGNGRTRVWSVIITAFGDLLPGRRGDFPARALQEVMATLGIEPGAVRTALSRLAKEGWVIRERAGRSSAYRLSPEAVPTFDLAARTIYAPERPKPGSAGHVIIGPDGSAATEADAIALARNVWLVFNQGEPEAEAGFIRADLAAPLPDWAHAVLAPPDLRAGFEDLMARFGPLDSATLAPVEAAAMRVALVHAWRRLALRHPRVPDTLLPEDWPEPECRRFMRALHAELGGRAAPWLSAALPATRERDALQEFV